MAGPDGKPWTGDRNILKRKRQVPDPSYGPKDVVTLVLRALQSNDDPQLDHGALVTLEFKSSGGVLASTNLDPAGYGRFLRGTDYSKLLDFKSFDFLDEGEHLQNGSVRMSVQINGWAYGLETVTTVDSVAYFDFYLSQEGNVWLIDAILLNKGVHCQ